MKSGACRCACPSRTEVSDTSIVIGVVGPCSAGKSTLIRGLQTRGFNNLHHIAQEHSYVSDMWQRLVHPDVLIYLDVTYEESMRRRPLRMSRKEFEEQVQRLQHARQHADLYLSTDQLSTEQVLALVLAHIKKKIN